MVTAGSHELDSYNIFVGSNLKSKRGTVRKKILAGVVVLLGFITGIVVTEAPANASFSDCTLGHGCVYVDINGGWPKLDIVWSVYYQNSKCWNFSSQFRNTISSMIETFGNGGTTHYTFQFFNFQNCDGQGWTMKDDSSINFPGTGSNDNIESFRIVQVP